MPSTPAARSALAITDWRQRVFALYAQVRSIAGETSESGSASALRRAHHYWRSGRDELFAHHPASPLSVAAKKNFAGLHLAPYDPAARLEAEIGPEGAGEAMDVRTGTDGVVPFERVGTADCDDFGTLAVWRLKSYGGGLFVPVRDGLAGHDDGTYGGGRYVLDTVKGAHLGGGPSSVIIDFNFAYNPSCAYDEAWACPLPGPANRLDAQLPFGELYAQY